MSGISIQRINADMFNESQPCQTRESVTQAQAKREAQTYSELSEHNIRHSMLSQTRSTDPFNNAIAESDDSSMLYTYMQPDGFMDTESERHEQMKKNETDESAMLAPTSEVFQRIDDNLIEKRQSFVREGYLHDLFRKPVDEIKETDRTSSKSAFYM